VAVPVQVVARRVVLAWDDDQHGFDSARGGRHLHRWPVGWHVQNALAHGLDDDRCHQFLDRGGCRNRPSDIGCCGTAHQPPSHPLQRSTQDEPGRRTLERVKGAASCLRSHARRAFPVGHPLFYLGDDGDEDPRAGTAGVAIAIGTAAAASLNPANQPSLPLPGRLPILVVGHTPGAVPAVAGAFRICGKSKCCSLLLRGPWGRRDGRTALATELGFLAQFRTARSAQQPRGCHLTRPPHCRSHQYRVTAGQPTCALSRLRFGLRVARYPVPRGVAVWGRIPAMREVRPFPCDIL
jgi:hypothetical protein